MSRQGRLTHRVHSFPGSISELPERHRSLVQRFARFKCSPNAPRKTLKPDDRTLEPPRSTSL